MITRKDFERFKEIRKEFEDDPNQQMDDDMIEIQPKDLLERIESGHSNYNIRGGLDALRKLVADERE